MSECQEKKECSLMLNDSSRIQPKPVYRPWDFGDWSLLILFIFGTFGNALSILIMNKKRLRNTNATLFVTGIAIADTVLLFFKLISNIVKIYRINVYDLCIIIQTVPQTAMFISIWLIMIMSCERMVAVRYPLQVAIKFSKTRCKIIISVMIFFFLIFTSICAVCMEHVVKQPYYCQIKGSQNGTCFAYHSYIFPLFKSAFSSWFPSILGIVLNVLIVISLYAASRQRKDLTNHRSLQSNSNSQSKMSFPSFYECANNNRIVKFKNDVDTTTLDNSIIEHGERYASRVKFSKNVNADERELLDIETIRVITNHEDKARERRSQDSESYFILERSSSNWRFKRLHNWLSTLLQPNYNQQPKDKQITIMLLTVSIAFIVLTLPYNTFELLRKLGFDFKFLKSRNALRFCMFFIDLNHSTNFLIYCASTQRFRNELKEIMCRILGIKIHKESKINKNLRAMQPQEDRNSKHKTPEENSQ